MERKNLCPNCLSPLTEGRTACPYCGQQFEGTNPVGCLPYGSLLGGRYTVGSYVAADGEGLIYQAVENTSSVRVVIKEYYPVTLSDVRCADGHIEPKAGSEVLFKTNRMDFADLYRSIQRITPAAGLVAVLDVIEQNNTAYAVLETPQGISLERYLSYRGGTMSVEDASAMMQPILEGVAAMHKAGLVHRGIAPDNIYITEGGAARLSGYATLGLRTAGSELKSQLYEGYSAPEQYSAAEFEGRYTDVYGLGAVFYRMLTGTTPMSAAQRKVADSHHGARSLQSSIPGYLSDVLGAAMRLQPAERIQNVPELMGALKSQNEATAAIRRGRKRSRKKVEVEPRSVFTGLLIVIAVLVLVLIWAVLRKAPEKVPDSSSQPAVVEPAEITLPVPNFTGMTFAQIEKNEDYTANFSFALTEEYHDSIPKGAVIRQVPLENTQLGQSDSRLIQLYVSKGPELTPMPNIIGFTKENASSELTSHGIRFSMVLLPNEGEYVSDCVVKTSIPAGENVDVSSEIITVYIAGDREIAMPESSQEENQG